MGRNGKILLIRKLAMLIILLSVTPVLMSLYSYVLSAAVTIVGFDTVNYPSVTCKFVPTDDWNRLIPSLPKEEVTLLDNGVTLPIVSYKQLEFPKDSAAIAISFDLGIGQRTGGVADFEYAKIALNEAISFIDVNTTKTALLSFDQISIIESDFTDATNNLATIATGFKQSLYSNIFNGLFSKFVGAIEFLESSDRPIKSLFLVTQGLISNDEMILLVNKAKMAGVVIYVMYINEVVPANIKQLAEETGGYALGRNELDKKRSAAIASLVKLAEGVAPIEITGLSNVNCDGKHTFTLQTQNTGYNSHSIEIEQKKLQYIEADPKYLDYSSILPGTSFDKTIKLYAKNGVIDISSIQLLHANFSIVSMNPAPPVLLQPDEFIEITVRFSPQDSSIVFAQLIVFSSACSGDTINITGGYPNVPPTEKTIKIITPKCNEVIVIGEPLEINWTGLLPKDVIQLEYSYGNTKNWDTLGINVANLTYSKHMPFKETDSLRIRAIQLWPNNVYKTYDLVHEDFVTTAFFNSAGDRIISTCEKLKQAYIWNASNGELLFTFEFDNRVTWAKYMFDSVSMQDKYIGITAGDSVYLYNVQDNSLHWARKINSTVNSIEFSKDGEYAAVSSNDGYLTVFEVSTGGIKLSVKTGGFNCRYAQFHPNKKYEIMTIASSGGIIRFFDINGKKTDSIDVKEGLSNAQSQYATYNHDGTKIAYTNITTKKLLVLDVINKNILYKISHPNEDVIILFADFFHTNTTDEILTAAVDKTLRRWRVSDGEPTEKDNIFDQHHNTVNTGVFSFDGKRVLSASNDNIAKIWNLDQRILQADTTCYLRVGRAKISCQDTVNIGESYVGQLSIKTISNILINATTPPKFKFNIKSIRIIGENSDEFGISDNIKFPFLLSTNIGLDLSLFFNPKDTGRRTANIEIILPADTVYIVLVGTGVPQEIQILTNYIDFGKVYTDDFKDSVVALVVNNSPERINITDISISGINYMNYRNLLENTIESIKLEPKDTLKLPLRFIPFVAGKKNAVIEINHDYNKVNIKSNLLGAGANITNDTLSISIKNIFSEVGRLVELPINYETTYSNSTNNSIDTNNNNNTKLDINKIYVNLSFNSSMLAPVNESTEINILEDEIFAGRRNILISMPYKPDKQTINGLKFRVALGNDSTTTLDLKNAYCDGTSRVYTRTTGARFDVTNICHADGSRFFDEKGRISLSQSSPNPAFNHTVINYEVLERGLTTIKLYNQAGELVKVLVSQELPIGSYQLGLDVSDLSAGVYYYVLTTATMTKTRSMVVEK